MQGSTYGDAHGGFRDESAPATDAAKRWQGWGTALKPAHEPIILARKPLIGTVAQNVAAHGTGALNVDGCRIATTDNLNGGTFGGCFGNGKPTIDKPIGTGRWPANLCLDEDAAAMLDEQSGERGASGKASGPTRGKLGTQGRFGSASGDMGESRFYGDSGGASRFFYCAKASRSEREAGLDSVRIVYVDCPLWENADHRAKLRVDMGQSRPRVIAVSGAPCNDVTVWNTFLFGSDTTAPYLTGSKSITGTATSSTTDWTTSNSFLRWLTSGCTEDASGGAVSGGSRAESAASGTRSVTITSEWTVSARGVERAPSPTPFAISAGGSPADHPTVKPIALMRWLCRLVTPKDGLILDPFCGSGSTGCAAVAEGFRFIGIEREAEYVAIAERRIDHWMPEQEALAL